MIEDLDEDEDDDSSDEEDSKLSNKTIAYVMKVTFPVSYTKELNWVCRFQ